MSLGLRATRPRKTKENYPNIPEELDREYLDRKNPDRLHQHRAPHRETIPRGVGSSRHRRHRDQDRHKDPQIYVELQAEWNGKNVSELQLAFDLMRSSTTSERHAP